MYARIGWALLVVMAAIIGYGTLVARFVETPRWIGFRLLITLLFCFSLMWWKIADRRIVRHMRRSGYARLARGLIATFTIAINLPILFMILNGHMPGYLVTWPSWYAAAFTIWHLGLVVLLPGVAIIRLAVLGMWHLLGKRLRHEAGRPSGGGQDIDPTRRAWLRTAAATVPLLGLGGAVTIASRQENRLAVNRHICPAPWLPERLEGLTLTHISDLHVGRHYRPHMLRQLVDKVNDLKSDLILVTGDIVDVSNDMLPPALHALSRMEHREGLYICVGNHDLIDSRRDFIHYTRAQGFSLLINERRTLRIGGEVLTIAGLDYSGRHASAQWGFGDKVNALSMLEGHDIDREGPIIGLAHHPHAFETLADLGIPLTLSGHTHGGQIMLTRQGVRPAFGAGSLMFRYIHGLYHRGGGTLFVNAGVGNWFPLRARAPAEVVQIQLV